MRSFRLPFFLLLILVTIHSLLGKVSTTQTSSARQRIPPEINSPATTLTTTIQPAIYIRRFDGHYAHLPLGWNLYYTTWTQILPSLTLIQHLDTAYTTIILNALRVWSRDAQRPRVVIDIGYIQMEFLSETRTIPWEFVAAFAQQARAQMVKTGFCGFYAVMLSHAASGHVVQVALRLNPALVPARTGGTRGV